MTTQTEMLTYYGIKNAAALVAAAKNTGVPLWIAAAVAQKESNGANIYGHDAGGTFYGKGAVTEANYKQFYDLVVNQGKKSNGVGPMQITYRAYFPMAKSQGLRLWLPIDNFIFGLRLVAKSLNGVYTTSQIQRAGTLYNAGNLTNGINAYGYDLAKKAAIWKVRLASATVEVVPRILALGSTGTDVKNLQIGLMRVFPSYAFPIVTNGGADGKFGPATEAVVKEFQSRVALYADGVVGFTTRTKLADYGITF